MRALGIDAGLDPGLARDLAARCQELGYDSLWANDAPDAPGLETLAHFAAGAPELELGVGVLPLQRYEAAGIAADVERLGLDPARLWLGIGSGLAADADRAAAARGRRAPRPASRRDADRDRRDAAAPVPPRRRDRGRRPPQLDAARRRRAGARVGARGRRGGGARGAGRRLLRARRPWDRARRSGSTRWRGATARSLRARSKHFEALDVPLGTVGVAEPTAAGVREGLAPYTPALDLTIARVLAEPEAAALDAVAEAAAPDPR